MRDSPSRSPHCSSRCQRRLCSRRWYSRHLLPRWSSNSSQPSWARRQRDSSEKPMCLLTTRRWYQQSPSGCSRRPPAARPPRCQRPHRGRTVARCVTATQVAPFSRLSTLAAGAPCPCAARPSLASCQTLNLTCPRAPVVPHHDATTLASRSDHVNPSRESRVGSREWFRSAQCLPTGTALIQRNSLLPTLDSLLALPEPGTARYPRAGRALNEKRRTVWPSEHNHNLSRDQNRWRGDGGRWCRRRTRP